MVMLAASVGRRTLKEHLCLYLGERRPSWAVLVCCRIPALNYIAHVKLPALHRTALIENLIEEEAPFRGLIETEQLQAVYIVPSALFCFMAMNSASLHGQKSETLLT